MLQARSSHMDLTGHAGTALHNSTAPHHYIYITHLHRQTYTYTYEHTHSPGDVSDARDDTMPL